jgi:predicted ArsR family transcriptional regulator
MRFPFSIQSLADELSTSHRNARRYLDTLEVTGLVKRTQTNPSLYRSTMRLVNG